MSFQLNNTWKSFVPTFSGGVDRKDNESTKSFQASSSSKASFARKKDVSPPVAPDSTTEPPPRPVKLFQEGDDVFYFTDDGDNVLGTVGQIVGQTCQVLFGDGTQQWASFKRIKKLSTTFDDDGDTSVSRVQEAPPSSPSAHKSKKSKTSKSNEAQPKEGTVEMFCANCGIKKKISIRKARTFKPEGPHTFKCRKCNKLSDTDNLKCQKASEPNNFFCLPPTPQKPQEKPAMRTSCYPVKHSQTSVQSSKSKDPRTVSGSGSPSNSDRRSSSSSSSVAVRIPGLNLNLPAKRKSYLCFSCQQQIEEGDCLPCNLCRRFCHLSCLPLVPTPPRGDKFWDLMCDPCGKQNNEGSNRGRVFSVRRNITSWADIAHLGISCLAVEKPEQQFFEDSEIVNYIQRNLQTLHLPRQYKVPTPDERQKFILHALFSTNHRFINGKEAKKRSTQWALRNEQPENKKAQKQVRLNTSPQLLQTKDKVVTHNHNQPASLSISIIPSKSTAQSFEFTDRPRKSSENYSITHPVKDIVSCDKPLSRQPIDDRVGHVQQSSSRKSNGPCMPNLTGSRNSEFVQSSRQIPSIENDGCSLKRVQLPAVEFYESKPKEKLHNRKAVKRSLPLTLPGTDHSSGTQNNTNTFQEQHKSQLKRHISISNESKLSEPPAKLPKISLSSSLKEIDTIIRPSPVKKTAAGSLSPGRPTLNLPQFRLSTISHGAAQEKTKPQNEEQRVHHVFDKNKPRAVKSTNIVPTPAPQVQAFLEETKSETKASPEKSEKCIKSKLKSSPLKSNVIKHSAAITKLRLRTRGRPLGAPRKPIAIAHNKRNQLVKNDGNSTRHPKLAPLKLTRIPNGIAVSKSAKPDTNGYADIYHQQRSSKRIIERNIEIEGNSEGGANSHSINRPSLMDAIMYGDYRVQCLPSQPRTEGAKHAETLKVFGHFRTEKQNETASLLLGRSETETRSQTRRKSEMFFRQKRDLNDFDSYDVVGRRTLANGLVQHYVIWKGEVSGTSDDDEETEYEDSDGSPVPRQDIIGLGSESENENSDEEMPEIVAECSAREISQTTLVPDCIDLTLDDSDVS